MFCTLLELKLIAVKEMPILDNIFTTVENYDGMSVQYLAVGP